MLSWGAYSDLGSLVQFVLGYEDDAHTPATMGAEQLDELDGEWSVLAEFGSFSRTVMPSDAHRNQRSSGR